MSLPEISIRRPVFAWMLMLALIVFGMLSFDRLGVSALPDVDFPVVGVSFSLPGAAPEVMESQVLDPVEDAIMQIDGIRSITSTAQQSSGRISVEFELGHSIESGIQEIQTKVNQVRDILPADLRAPQLRKSNPEDQPLLWIGVTSDDPKTRPSDLMMFARNELYDQFTSVAGVGDVALSGYVEPALQVWMDLDRLERLDMTSDDVLQAIKQESLETPLGQLEGPDKQYNLRFLGEASSPEQFSRLPIASRRGLGVNFRPTRLGEVADIEEGLISVRSISRYNGQRTVGLGIVKQHGANAVEVAKLARERLEQLQPTIPKPYKATVRLDNTRFISQAVHHLLFTLLLSALLTSVVCYLFLGSVSSTINVLMAIPTSIIGAFTAFYFFGFTLNTFTLLGLSLAIGIVVDDAIMMLENIVRHRELGLSRRKAAIVGSKEITFAAVAATIAIVAIFLPVVFMRGILGRYFLQYGVTVTVAVLLSLLEALTLTPMRCSRYLEVAKHPAKGLAGFVDRTFSRLGRVYSRTLGVLLRHRLAVCAAALAVFAASFLLARRLPGEMLPPQDQSMVMMRFKLPVGSSVELTDSKIRKVEDYLSKQPEVEGVLAVVGGFGADAVNQGNAIVTLVPRALRKATQQEFIARARKELRAMMAPPGKGGGARDKGKPNAARSEGAKPGPGGGKHDAASGVPQDDTVEPPTERTAAEGQRRRGGTVPPGGMEITIQDMSLRGFSSGRGFPIELVIQGPEWEQLRTHAKQIMGAIQQKGLGVDVHTDVQEGMPEIQLIPNREALSRHGVQLSSVTGVINTLMGGAQLARENQYSKDGHRYSISVRLKPSQRDEAIDLSRVRIRNNRGETIPLSKLVDSKVGPSLMLISREERARAIRIYGNPAPGQSQQQAIEGALQLARAELPPGYSVRAAGSSQGFKDSIQSLFVVLLLGILVSYMVLASQFNSFIHPIAVLVALPFSVMGALIALWITGQSLNVYSMIGLILLMGIVKKNSILLVDFTNQRRAAGLGVREALLEACPVRLRPVLMTSVATIAGALPEAIAMGPGAETTIPMAIAIIGGVIASTVLTLLVVPCAYSLLTRLERPDQLAEPTLSSHLTRTYQ